MRGTTDRNSLQFDPEIEKIARRNQKLAKQRKGKGVSSSTGTELVIMAEDGADPPRKTPKRTMGDYMTLNLARTATRIVNPAVNANNFEIKPSLISLVQQSSFSGSELEDPNQHIETLLQICDTIKMNGVPEDALRVRLFPFSLTGKARAWLRSYPTGSLSTWDIITTKFLENFFPSSKYTKLMSDISCFTQGNEESFCEVWERFKELLRKCAQHELQDYDQASPTPSYAKPPYPQRLKQQIQKQQYVRFLDIFKKLQINIPFAKALENMPNYAKFMKDLLSKKHKLQEAETVALTQ
ncbi:hypothetical protein QN277_006078 [Acacia crassicarpa]|uniref:Retrotransposon gag domain-containing protein n=1 Tax=Acacia crassicarpa TaxID=499986 RepID=A0AAE1J0H1_9FABA|nr:hypothetical protein QN277_006078 [Acacia crassicarpa]